MRLKYLLLSPTFGMHQYTADLANRLAAEPGMEVHLVTTASLPRDRYSPRVRTHTPIAARSTGFSTEGLDLPALRRVLRTVDQIAEGNWQLSIGNRQAASPPPLLPSPPPFLPFPPFPPFPPPPPPTIHLPAVHLWNLALVPALRRRGYRVIQTLHDLDPHVGVRFGPLIRLWNRLIIRWADQLLVHGQVYRRRLRAQGVAPERVVAVPLLHGFLSYAHSGLPAALADHAVACEPWALFFGRLERYKGVATLLEAAALAGQAGGPSLRLLLAGQGELASFWSGPLPPGVEVRPRRIDDAEAIDLVRRCGLLVLPHLDASQSTLVAAAYAFHKPVLVTRAGALPEYVQEGVTGWVVPPGDAPALAATLQSALADPSRLAAMGQAGWQWYQAQPARFTTIPICIDPDQVKPIDHSPFPNSPINHSPSPNLPIYPSTNLPSPTILHLGTMFWPPNVAGVLWFARDVLPLICQQLPAARFVIVGKNPPPDICSLTSDPRIQVTGYVADPQPYLQAADAFVVPLHSGGGMRVKILDAWLWGLPIVSTPIGAEGIDLVDGDNILLAGDAPAFAAAALRLLADAELNQRLRRAGRRWVEQTYAWQVVYRRVDAVLEQICQ